MTAFTKQNLIKDTEYVLFAPTGHPYAETTKFVARFKHARSSMGPFMTFLRKNFTVEEYLARREADESPLAIAESKGFVLSHIKKWLKDAGLPQTQAGYETWKAARRAAA